jgi:hypothetical protein
LTLCALVCPDFNPTLASQALTVSFLFHGACA